MNWLTCFLILSSFIHLTLCKDCIIDNRSVNSEWEKKLHEELGKCYSPLEAPINNTIVQLKIFMKYFTIDDYDDSFFAYSHAVITWKDERLKWNPKDYYDITDIEFFNYQYWMPPIISINEGEQEDYVYFTMCTAKSTGQVLCMPNIESIGHCISYITTWPYDTKKCTLNYGQGNFEKSQIILAPRSSKTASLLGAEYGAEWIITDYQDDFNVTDKIKIRLTFTLERNAEGLASVIIYPSVLLAILTLVTLFREVDNFKRFWMTCFVVLCHIYYLQTLSILMPNVESDIPAIIIFYRFSLLLSSLLVILTLGLKQLKHRKIPPPVWVTSVNSLVFNSYGKYIVWPRWKVKVDLITSELVNVKDVEAWNDFANLLNSLLIVFCKIMYLIMMLVYVPRPPPLTF